MKDLIKILASALILMLGVVSTAGATLLDFSDSGNLGLNLGGNMLWNGIGGGHLYVEQYNDQTMSFSWTPRRTSPNSK